MENDGPRRLILEAGHYCTKHGALGSNLFTFQEEFLCIARFSLRKSSSGSLQKVRERLSGDFRQERNAVEGGANANTLAIRFLDPHYRGLAESPTSGAQTHVRRQHNDQFQLGACFHAGLGIKKNSR
jgi:hypothetical protein